MSDPFRMAELLRPRFLPASAGVGSQKQAVTTPDTAREQTEQVTEQVAAGTTEQVPALVQLTSVQWTIVEHADTPRTLNELLEITGYRQRPYFKSHHLEPLLQGGVLRMTVPDKPRSSKQQYVLTDTGVKLKAMHERTTAPKEQDQDSQP